MIILEIVKKVCKIAIKRKAYRILRDHKNFIKELAGICVYIGDRAGEFRVGFKEGYQRQNS